MFNRGDMIIYQTHGVCYIDDICERLFQGEKKAFYVLHPLDNEKLVISIPVDSKSVRMLELLRKEEAEEILDSFRLPGRRWIEIANERNQIFGEIVKSGNRMEISKVVSTLMRKRLVCESEGKKMNDKDRQLLSHLQGVLFMELAIALGTTCQAVQDRVVSLIRAESADAVPIRETLTEEQPDA